MGTSLVSKSLPVVNSNSVNRLFSARKKKYYVSTSGTSTFVGEMNASEVMECIKKEATSFRVEELPDTRTESCVSKFSDEFLVLYVSVRPLYE